MKLQKYVVRFEKDNEKDKLKLMIEDRLNRYDLSFDKPRKDQNYAIKHAEGEKEMMARGTNLTIDLVVAKRFQSQFYCNNKNTYF